jgi:hypothetical protein
MLITNKPLYYTLSRKKEANKKPLSNFVKFESGPPCKRILNS